MLFAKLEIRQRLAIFVESYLKPVYMRIFTDAQVSEYIELNQHTYRRKSRT